MADKYKHSHKYTHKTSRGNTLEVKNNIVYLNGKRAPANYAWHDKNNGNTYNVTKDGTYELIGTAEGKRRPLEDYQKSNRKFFEDRSYEHYLESIGEENWTGRDKLYKYRGEFVDKRYEQEEPYSIPQHLPGVKRRTLSSGKYKGIRVYDNTLDSIRVNAEKNNIPFETLLGLAAETSLGRDYPLTFNKTKEDYNDVKKNPFYIQQFITGDKLYPTDILNNHNYFVGNNATGAINTLIAKGLIPGTKSWEDGQPFPVIGGMLVPNGDGSYNLLELTKEQNDTIDKEAERVLNSKEKSSSNPWTNAIEFYKNSNYGMGQNYKNTVNERGKDIIDTKEVQSYLRRSLEDGRTKKSSGGSIHIAPSKRGTFTAAATKHGMGVQEFVSRVLRNKDSYSPAMVKKANFARNASKWNH